MNLAMKRTKRLADLTLSEFLLILPPEKGSDRNAQTVALADSQRDSCCSLFLGDLDVKGDRDFARIVKTAYDRTKLNSTVIPGSGFAPRSSIMNPPEPPTLFTLQPKTDTTSAEVRLPILVYESSRKPGKNADGTAAEDMTRGQWSAEKIRNITTVGGTRLFELDDLSGDDPRPHFDAWLNMATSLFGGGELDMVVRAMIGRVRDNWGGEFRHPALALAVWKHPNTQQFADRLLKVVNQQIQKNKGVINPLSLQEWMTGYQPPLVLPAFNTTADRYLGWLNGGLTMAINGVWAGKAEITQFEQAGNVYRGNVKVTFYDHFGLDLPDVGPDPDTGRIKEYGGLVGFRSWFILQHLDKFGYKPFLTVVEMNYPIKGKWQ